MKMIKKDKFTYFLPVLVFIVIITRFYKLADFFNFGIDEEYQALLSWSIVKDFHILLIGVSASNIGYYLGPGLIYLGAFLLWLSKGNPLSFAYFASFVGIATSFSLYYIVKSIFNRKVALISLVLYTFSPFAFYYDRKYWPIGVPLVALWLFFSLIKAFKNPRWLILTAFLMGVSYHLHISLWIFWPIFFFTFLFLLYKKKVSIWLTFQSLLIFFLITLPLFIFDLVHNFDNLLMPIRLIKARELKTVFNPLARSSYFIQSFTKILFITDHKFLQNLVFFIFFICLVFLVLKKKDVSVNIIGFLIVFFSLAFLFFPSPMQEYYFVLVLPFIIIISALTISYLPIRFSYLVLGLFIFINLYSIVKNPMLGDYHKKIEIINKIALAIKKKPFILETKKEYIADGGWRYLFQSHDLTPVASSADSMFGWIYPDEISNIKPKYKITILSDQEYRITKF